MRPASATALALVLAGCASAPPRQPPPPSAPPGAPEVRAVRVSVPPMVDGVANDVAWAEAQDSPTIPFSLMTDEGLRLQAVVHRGTLFLLARWPDKREDFRDIVLVYLPMGRTSGPDSGSAEHGPVDVWRWSSTETNATGHARDAFISADSGNGFEDWVSNTETDPSDKDDDGRSAGDVLAVGRWERGEWTLEFARALSTGHSDDCDMAGLSEVTVQMSRGGPGSIGGIDLMYSLGYTPVLRLLLPPPVPEDRQGPFPDPRGGPRERR